MERNLLHLLQTGEDHAGDPEENDIIARDHHGRGVPVVQISCVLIRPAHRGKRPECGAEPGVEHVLVAVDVLAVARLALAGVLTRDGDVAAVVAVPRGDLVSPPELAGDTPVVHVLHPIIIGLAEALRHELDAPVTHGFDRRLGQRLHLHKPLGAGKRLHRRAAAVAGADVVVIILHLDEIAFGFQIGHDGVACLVAVHAVVLAAVDDLRVLVDHENLLQIVTQADLIVVRIVARGHLHAAGAEVFFDVFVRHDRQLAPHQRENGRLADQMRIALILRMDGDARIAQHGFRTCRSDDHILVTILDRIADVPEMAGHVFIFDLRVGERGSALRTPVDDAVAFVDQALFIQLAERLAHGLGAALVHHKAAAAPVAGGAERLLLLDDTVAVLVLPRPDAVEEFLTAKIVARESLFFAEVFLHLDLRGNAGVVIARQPQRRVALHALIAREDVLQRRVERVAHVELASDVRGRHDDGKRLFVRIRIAFEIAALHPHVINFLLDLLGVVHLRKFLHLSSSFVRILRGA